MIIYCDYGDGEIKNGVYFPKEGKSPKTLDSKQSEVTINIVINTSVPKAKENK